MLLGVCRYLLSERRALRRQVATLALKLEHEAARNRQREDELISRLLTHAGSYGIEPRKAAQAVPAKPTLTEAPLNAIEEATRDAYIQAALDAGKTVQEGEEAFQQRRTTRLFEVYQPPGEMM